MSLTDEFLLGLHDFSGRHTAEVFHKVGTHAFQCFSIVEPFEERFYLLSSLISRSLRLGLERILCRWSFVAHNLKAMVLQSLHHVVESYSLHGTALGERHKFAHGESHGLL